MEGGVISSFQNLSLSHKSSIPSEADEPPYIVQIALQTGVSNSRIAAACTDNTIRLFSSDTLSLAGSISGHTGSVTDVKFGKSDQNTLYSSSTDQTVRCWDLRTKSGKEVQKFTAPLKGEFECLCLDMNQSESLLCCGTETPEGDETHLLYWDRRAGSLLGSYTDCHDDSITRVSFQPGSDRLLASAGADGIVCVFDVNETAEDDALQMTFNIEACVVALGWCGEKYSDVYSTTSDHRFYAWDALQGDDRCFISREDALKEDEREYLVDCIPSVTTGSLLVAGSYSGSLCLLLQNEGRDCNVISTLTGGHTDTVRCLLWDSQTKSLFTGGEDATLCLWSSVNSAVQETMGKMTISQQKSSRKKPYDKNKSSKK